MKYNDIIEQFFKHINYTTKGIENIPDEIFKCIKKEVVCIAEIQTKYKNDFVENSINDTFYLDTKHLTKTVNLIIQDEHYKNNLDIDFSIIDWFEIYEEEYQANNKDVFPRDISIYYFFTTLYLMLFNYLIELYNKEKELNSNVFQGLIRISHCYDILNDIKSREEQKNLIENEYNGEMPKGKELVEVIKTLFNKEIQKIQNSNKYEPRQNIMEWNEFVRKNPGFNKVSFRKWINQAPMNRMNEMKVLRRIKGTTWIDIDIFWKWYNKESDRNREVISNWDF